MARSTSQRRQRPLDQRGIEELALRYVGRFATTKARLRTYLSRKIRERGWAGSGEPELEVLATQLSELGYIDDRAYAMSKSEALSSRGYGPRMLDQRLRFAGVGDDERAAAGALADSQAIAAALRFARRRSIGPYAAAAPDSRQREKAIAAMVRAGHSFALARAIAALPPGAEVNEDELRQDSRLTDI